MVVTPSRRRASDVPHAVVWHELECGAYDADLALWLELAARAHGPVLDIGAGTGRVTLALARAGFAVTALERERTLLDALRASSGGLTIECARADARAFSLPRRDYGACIVPMHTIQLFGDEEQRGAFLRCAHGHLRPRGLLAVAILSAAEPFDVARGHVGPVPESASVDGLRFVSTPTRVAVAPDAIVIERERSIRPLAERGARTPAPVRQRDVLARVSASQLHAEADAAGFSRVSTRRVRATEEHVGSEVVVARA